MNPLKIVNRWFLAAAAMLVAAFSIQTVQAHPYASGITNNSGTISFILNEGGGTVWVVFEDNTTNNMGVLNQGVQSFALGSHTSYAIYVKKVGNGTPAQISSDTDVYTHWNSPRGVAVNSNPKIGSLFGRTYIGNSSVGGTAPYNKGHGLYVLNSDLTEALGSGNTALTTPVWGTSTSNPWRMRVAPNNDLLVNGFSGNGELYMFSPDLSSSNAIFTPDQRAGIHGDMFGTPDLLVTNIGGTDYLTLWVFDSGMGVPSGTTLGPGTSEGSFNCAYRYDLGADYSFPYTNPPDYAYTMGLDGIAELRTEGDIGKDGKIICGFGRGNYSNPNIQILDPSGANILWTSFDDSGGTSDPWNGVNGSGAAVGTYAGVRVSPDGRFLASVDIQNGITIATLTNGIPDDSSIFGIQNASNVGNSRGMDWDAADNVLVCSSGQGLLRVYSLGITTTCITSNDWTGTNGTFQLILPSAKANVAVTQPTASQNYINSTPAGTPLPGVFTISLDQSTLDGPVTVNFTRSGSAAYLTNYTLNLGTDANGVIISTNSVTFPAGAHPGGGDWTVDVQVIPTATPVIGPTLTVTLRVVGGSTYLAGSSSTGTISILNTGPQLLVLSPSASGSTMSRGIAGDYARFIITRYGDLNGPGSSAGNISPHSFTVTNFTFAGTASYPLDYTASAQRSSPPPVDGAPGIVIAPGEVTITNLIGNPVAHNNLNLTPTNVTIVISLTNPVTGTTATSLEGYDYSVSNAVVTLTELDNTIGPEVVLWSDSLNSAADSVNWTLAFAATSFATNTVPPVVIPNYVNGATSISDGGTNDFNVEFGSPVANDSVPLSPAMSANGWANALRMTVNKNNAAAAGVNLYPQGKTFQGNYAFRFSMYLSMYSGAVNNPYAGTIPYEFAAFGINHTGANCNWRLASPLLPGTGNGTTNADGIWFAIDAGDHSITPADYDAFTSPALPNAGVTADLVSRDGVENAGIFKNPPFTTQRSTGGEPVYKWVDVSVEVTAQTNVTLYMNRAPVLSSFNITNGGNYTSGTVMLGYLDPVSDVSDNSAFAYYSNLRVVELSPYLTGYPLSVIAVQGDTVSLTNSAAFGSSPISNAWYVAGTTSALQTDTANATNITSVLTLNNVQTGTNYFAISSDPAGSVTGSVASVEVIVPPLNQTVIAGTGSVQFTVIPNGPSAPTAYQWQTNGVNLVNDSHYAGVTTPTLTITNVQLADAGIYSVVVSNPAGTVIPSATLTVNRPLAFTTVKMVGTDLIMGFTSPNPSDTTSSFTLQSSGVVQGPFTNTAGVFTGGSGTFQVSAPIEPSIGSMFYRLIHN